MPDREIAQLVLQVDANIAVAQRELQNLARVVRQSSGDMNNSLATTEVAHQRLGRAFGQTRIAQMELSHVVTASVDAYAAGFSPLRIMTLEMGRLAEAATFLGGGGGGVLGKVAGFMSGPWGIAVLLGVSVLSQLIGKHGEASSSVEDLVEKMRKQAKQAADSKLADDEWARSIDGLIERNQKLTDEIKKRLKAEEDLDTQTLRQARSDKSRAEQDLQDAKTRLANLKAQQAAQPAGSVGIGQGASTTSVDRANLARQIQQAQRDVEKAGQGIAAAQAAIVQNTIAVGEEEGKALADLGAGADLWAKRYTQALHDVENANHGALAGSSGVLTEAFTSLKKGLGDVASAGLSSEFYKARTAAKDLGNELASGKLSPLEYAKAVKQLAASLEAAAEAAKNAKKGAGEFGKQIGFADAEAIAKSAGLTVTSGYRQQFGHGAPGHSTQEDLYNDPEYNRPGNPVARPGTSAHGGVNGKWALDIAFAPGLSAEKLKKLYGDQGVSLSAVYKEKGHFHIEGSRSQAAAAETAAARAAQKQLTDDDQFARESAQLDAETLAARKQLIGGYDTQADLAAAEVEAERLGRLASIQKQLDAKQITQTQAEGLRLQVDDLAAAKEAGIAHRKYVDGLQQAAAAVAQVAGFQLDDLKFADDMAKTQGERRKLELQIVDIQYQQKEADLERLKKTIESNKDFATSVDLQNQAKGIQAQIDRLPTEKGHDKSRVEQGTLDPLEQWAKNVPKTAADINEALQSIEVQGIDNLADAIAGVVTGTESLGKAFKNIANEIVADIIRMTIRMLIFKAISSIFGGGFKLGGGASGVSGAGGGFLPGLATGGPTMGGQPYIVGERGPELFVPSGNGTILPKVPRISVAGVANNNDPIELIVHSAPSPDAWAQVDQISATRAGQAVKVSVDHTNNRIRTLQRPSLMRG